MCCNQSYGAACIAAVEGRSRGNNPEHDKVTAHMNSGHARYSVNPVRGIDECLRTHPEHTKFSCGMVFTDFPWKCYPHYLQPWLNTVLGKRLGSGATWCPLWGELLLSFAKFLRENEPSDQLSPTRHIKWPAPCTKANNDAKWVSSHYVTTETLPVTLLFLSKQENMSPFGMYS